MTKLLTCSAIIAASLWAGQAMADDGCMPPMQHKGEMENKSEEERRAFFEERKAKWEGMSDAEKVEMIEEKRKERMATMESHWDGLSDAEKVRCAEEQMKKFGDHKGDGRGPHGKRPH